jgi:hypothetical protein
MVATLNKAEITSKRPKPIYLAGDIANEQYRLTDEAAQPGSRLAGIGP